MTNENTVKNVNEEADKMVRAAFDQWKSEAKRLSEDLATTQARQQEVRKQIQRGARQTDGRIFRP